MRRGGTCTSSVPSKSASWHPPGSLPTLPIKTGFWYRISKSSILKCDCLITLISNILIFPSHFSSVSLSLPSSLLLSFSDLLSLPFYGLFSNGAIGVELLSHISLDLYFFTYYLYFPHTLGTATTLSGPTLSQLYLRPHTAAVDHGCRKADNHSAHFKIHDLEC